jgi:hypothetical protein
MLEATLRDWGEEIERIRGKAEGLGGKAWEEFLQGADAEADNLGKAISRPVGRIKRR